MLTKLRKTQACNSVDWDQLCVVHTAIPRFTFELEDDVVRLKLQACSLRDQSLWLWNGIEWQINVPAHAAGDKPEILDDPRLEPAVHWLQRLDWFTPEPGLWVGDANENFLNVLANAWPERPQDAEYLGNMDGPTRTAIVFPTYGPKDFPQSMPPTNWNGFFWSRNASNAVEFCSRTRFNLRNALSNRARISIFPLPHTFAGKIPFKKFRSVL